ncbi:hypothetical protein V8C44DRAFT_216065 [Trichoderma aethiopicum]
MICSDDAMMYEVQDTTRQETKERTWVAHPELRCSCPNKAVNSLLTRSQTSRRLYSYLNDDIRCHHGCTAASLLPSTYMATYLRALTMPSEALVGTHQDAEFSPPGTSTLPPTRLWQPQPFLEEVGSGSRSVSTVPRLRPSRGFASFESIAHLIKTSQASILAAYPGRRAQASQAKPKLGAVAFINPFRLFGALICHADSLSGKVHQPNSPGLLQEATS